MEIWHSLGISELLFSAYVPHSDIQPLPRDLHGGHSHPWHLLKWGTCSGVWFKKRGYAYRWAWLCLLGNTQPSGLASVLSLPRGDVPHPEGQSMVPGVGIPCFPPLSATHRVLHLTPVILPVSVKPTGWLPEFVFSSCTSWAPLIRPSHQMLAGKLPHTKPSTRLRWVKVEVLEGSFQFKVWK